MDALARIGSDLHDGPLQELAFLVGHLRALRTDLAAGVPAPELEDETRELEEVATELERSLRRYAATLSGGEAEPLRAAEEALGAVVERFRRRSGMQASLLVGGGLERLPPAVATALLRVAAEALENVRRHSGATRADVRVDVGDDTVRLEVADDGHGFDPAVRPPGLGRRAAAARVEETGGTLAVESTPGSGTVVRAELPLATP